MDEFAAAPLWETISRDDGQTRALGRRVGAACRGGEIVLLKGPLGAGKTCLAGGLAGGLGIEQPMLSPTFVILRSYRSPSGLALHHFDFYRLAGDDDLETIGLEDCWGEDAIILAEWPERCPAAFPEFTLRLDMEILDESSRRIRVAAGGLPMGAALRKAVESL